MSQASPAPLVKKKDSKKPGVSVGFSAV